MSDSAFATAAYPGYSSQDLLRFIAEGRSDPRIIAELVRRERVAEGDVSVMTAAERLRRIKK